MLPRLSKLLSKFAFVGTMAVLGHGVAVSQNMVPANILTRVFCLKIGEDLASAFTIEVSETQYLITARHALQSLGSNKKLQVLQEGKWVEIEFRRIPVELIQSI